MRLLTTVVGRINGTDFRAEGESECPELGQSQGELRFNKKIPNFSPMLGGTWNCNNHVPVAEMLFPETNPLVGFLDGGGRIMEYTTVEFPITGDSILVTSICARPEPDVQVVYQTRVGDYTGPIDIVEQLPFDVELTPVKRGVATGFSMREVACADGDRMPIRHHDRIFFSDDFELPLPWSMEISGEADYFAEELRLVLNTRMLARSSEGGLDELDEL